MQSSAANAKPYYKYPYTCTLMGNVLEGRRKIVRINHFNKRKTSTHRKEQHSSHNLFLGSICKTTFRMTSKGSLAIWYFKLLSLSCPIYLQKQIINQHRNTIQEWHKLSGMAKLYIWNCIWSISLHLKIGKQKYLIFIDN